MSESAVSPDRLYWSLERSDHEERADFRVAMSDLVDRVLVHLSADGRLITWITPGMLESLGLSESGAGARAFTNLGRALSEATVESEDIDGVQLGFIATWLSFKAALILAPNLHEVVGTVLGWPLPGCCSRPRLPIPLGGTTQGFRPASRSRPRA